MTENSFTNGKSNVQSKIASAKAVSDDTSILSIIDKSLKHLNQISEANFTAQDLYIELLKEKKTMKYDQIKKIYFTLTESKAKEILFERDKKQLIETDYQNHEGLIRLCWRSIEKLIKKITYYMINQNHLSVISKSVLKLIHLNQSFVRRFQKLKNSSMLFIVEMIEKLIEENSILQKKIYDILLNRGYVVSLDEFYKLNGYDAEHRQAYYAKKEQQIIASSSEDQSPDKQDQLQKSSAKNSRHQTIRKKKGFRMNPRYSWKQTIENMQNKENEKYPTNKTNFQIRQSFKNLIGDFLENQNLNEVLLNYKFQENPKIQKKQTKNPHLSQVSSMKKKIFENKIQSVINQLKSKSLKTSSKLLQIINISSEQAINSQLVYAQKRFIQRNHGERRQSIISHKKRRQSQSINDRKIINQSFFRELVQKNAKIQNFVNQEILKDANKMQQQLQNMAYQSPKPNPKVIKFNKKRHNQNHLKKSAFSRSPTNQMLVFNPYTKTKDITPSFKSIKSTFRFMETQLNCKYSIQSRKNIPESKHAESFAQKIRIAKQEWELRNQRNILQTIEKSTTEPSNLIKLTEVLHTLNTKKDLTAKTMEQKMKNLGQNQKIQGLIRKQKLRFETLQTESGSELYINNVANNEAKRRIDKELGINLNIMKRVKTEQSTRGPESNKMNKMIDLEGWKENKNYEIYDRRLRRILRR